MIFIVKCVTITSFLIVYAAFWWKSTIFIVLSSLETIHDNVKYRYCIFSLLNRLLRIRLKRHNSILRYVREREKVYCKCSVQYTLLLLYLMLIMTYCAQLNFTYLCMLHEYHVIWRCIYSSVLSAVFGNRGRSWYVLPADTAVHLYSISRICLGV